MQKLPDEPKLQQIHKMLGKIDVDKDGQLKVDDVLKVNIFLFCLSPIPFSFINKTYPPISQIIATIGKENVNLNETQIDELIELITKEETLENEEKIEKALAKSKEERRAVLEQLEEVVDKATKIADEIKPDENTSPTTKPGSKVS